MGIRLITYDGRVRAVCTPRRVYLADPQAVDTDPNARFVLAMCLYAGAVLNGHRPGPYRDDAARAYARALLIPCELGERRYVDVETVAAGLGVPSRELWLSLRRARCATARPVPQQRRRP